MPGVFETAARAAIEDLIKMHATQSKFGYLLTESDFLELTSDLFSLLETSRNLKTAGDRMLGFQPAPAVKTPRGLRQKSR